MTEQKDVKVIELKWENSLQTYLNQKDKIIILDFWAEWCWPCRVLWPVLHKIAELNDDIIVLKASVEEVENQELTSKFWVNSIPQVNIFYNWELKDQFIWSLPFDKISDKIQTIRNSTK